MVKLDKIYTRGGDKGATSLADGARRRKDDIRVEAYGAIDETNAAIGVARLAIEPTPRSTPCSSASRTISSILAPSSRRR